MKNCNADFTTRDFEIMDAALDALTKAAESMLEALGPDDGDFDTYPYQARLLRAALQLAREVRGNRKGKRWDNQ